MPLHLLLSLWVAFLLIPAPLLAQESTKAETSVELTVWDIGVWLGTSQNDWVANSKLIPSIVPALVPSARSEKMRGESAHLGPFGMIGFTGTVTAPIDLKVELEVAEGNILAHWPFSGVYDPKQSKVPWTTPHPLRLSAKADANARCLFISDDSHWLSQLREWPELNYLATTLPDARSEQFLIYDAEFRYKFPLTVSGNLQSGIQVANNTPYPVFDLLLVAKTESGWRYGWLDELRPVVEPTTQPAANPYGADKQTPANLSWRLFTVPKGASLGMKLSADGNHLITSDSKAVYIWNSKSQRLERRLRGHVGPIRAVAFAAQANVLATCGNDQRLLVWDWQKGTATATTTLDDRGTLAIALDDAGHQLATYSITSGLRRWDLTANPLAAVQNWPPLADVRPDTAATITFLADNLLGVLLSDAQAAKSRLTIYHFEQEKTPIYEQEFDFRTVQPAPVLEGGQLVLAGKRPVVVPLPLAELSQRKPATRAAAQQVAELDAEKLIWSVSGWLCDDMMEALDPTEAKDWILATGHDDGTVSFWRAGQTKPYFQREFFAQEPVVGLNVVTINSEQRFLLVCSPEGRVGVWQIPISVWSGQVPQEDGPITDKPTATVHQQLVPLSPLLPLGTASPNAKALSPEWDQLSQEWRQRLHKAGLPVFLSEKLVQQYLPRLQEEQDMMVLLRLDEKLIDQIFPLRVEPTPVQQHRCHQLLINGINPDFSSKIQQWIVQLGAEKFEEREQASAELTRMGASVVPQLREAVKNADPEIAFRAEWLLIELEP